MRWSELVPSAPALLHIQPFCRQLVEPESRRPLQVLGNQSDFLRALSLTRFLLQREQKLQKPGVWQREAGPGVTSGSCCQLCSSSAVAVDEAIRTRQPPRAGRPPAGLVPLRLKPVGAFPITPKAPKKILQIPHVLLSSCFLTAFKTLHAPVTRGRGVLEIPTWDRFQLRKPPRRRSQSCVSGERCHAA